MRQNGHEAKLCILRRILLERLNNQIVKPLVEQSHMVKEPADYTQRVIDIF